MEMEHEAPAFFALAFFIDDARHRSHVRPPVLLRGQVEGVNVLDFTARG
jgi:hypothetical protein